MKKILPLLLILVFSGCTQYIYQGQIRARDSLGKQRDHVIYWNKTQRAIWFDSAAGSLTLLSECSNNTVQYDEQEEGIIFRKRPNDTPQKSYKAKDCGKVIGAKHIKDIEEGNLKLTVRCEPEIDEFTVGGADSYLNAREEPYTFPITKKATKNLNADLPKRPVCRN